MVKNEDLPSQFAPILNKILIATEPNNYRGIAVEEDRHLITSPEALHEAMKQGDIEKDGDAALSLIKEKVQTQLAYLGILIGRHFNAKHVRSTGYFMYHENGYMRWHTNSNEEGTRFYISYPFGDAEFKYRDPADNKVKVIQEKKLKWQMKSFKIIKSALLWHSVSTDKLRLSIGYNVYE